jgi:hypothetical protein
MYCPKCGAEYREGYSICPDCNENLVNELPLEIKRQNLNGLSLNRLFNNHIEKWLKTGGIAYIFVGLLYYIIKSINNYIGAGNSSSKIIVIIFGLLFDILSTILWGLFYFWLGKILEILRTGFKNEQ